MPRVRRLRGVLLRVVLNRPLAIALGTFIATPGVLLMMRTYAWESGLTDGVALLTLATGIALFWSGVRGRKVDWY